MQITNDNLINKYKTNEVNLPPKVGDITQVTIKSRLDDRKAIVLLKGSEQTVEFEGNIPDSVKTMVEITKHEGNLTVRQIPTNTHHIDENEALNEITVGSQSKNKELKQAIEPFVSRNILLSKENIISIKHFLRSDPGTLEQKIDSLRMIAKKNISITTTNLISVHEALNGKSLSGSLMQIMDEMDVPFDPKMILERSTQKKENEVGKKITSIQIIKESVRQEPVLSKAIEQVKEAVKAPEMPKQAAEKIERAIREATQLQQMGRPAE
ncbi:hypothetical protein, partial [Bacillus sp. V5-8f]|uniref:hypothetical protein n=1 Tax=Bacillus sp. V5-8f TaxID=2053044 RepID=UPI000CC9BCEE